MRKARRPPDAECLAFRISKSVFGLDKNLLGLFVEVWL